MNNLIQFLMQHPIHTSLLLGLIVAYIIFEMKTGDGPGISPQAAVNLINHQHAAVLDIRAQEAFIKSKIVGSINVDINQIDKKNKKLAKLIKKPIIIVCDFGKTATLAEKKLKTEGFNEIYVLTGGIANWQKEGLPLTSKGE